LGRRPETTWIGPATKRPKPSIPVGARHTAIRLKKIEVEGEVGEDLHDFGEEFLSLIHSWHFMAPLVKPTFLAEQIFNTHLCHASGHSISILWMPLKDCIIPKDIVISRIPEALSSSGIVPCTGLEAS